MQPKYRLRTLSRGTETQVKVCEGKPMLTVRAMVPASGQPSTADAPAPGCRGPPEYSGEDCHPQIVRRLWYTGPCFRRVRLDLLMDEVQIGLDQIVIRGPKALIDVVVSENAAAGPVAPRFERKWRTRHDSNV
jgi:hypothetical protein